MVTGRRLHDCLRKRPRFAIKHAFRTLRRGFGSPRASTTLLVGEGTSFTSLEIFGSSSDRNGNQWVQSEAAHDFQEVNAQSAHRPAWITREPARQTCPILHYLYIHIYIYIHTTYITAYYNYYIILHVLHYIILCYTIPIILDVRCATHVDDGVACVTACPRAPPAVLKPQSPWCFGQTGQRRLQ